MKKIDLGSLKQFEITLNSDVHILREPSVKDISNHKEGIMSGDTDEFLSFLIDLGLPKEAANVLGISQLTALSQGILGDLAEKK